MAGPSGEVETPKNPTSWLSDNTWPDTYKQFAGLSHLEAFKGCDKHILEKPDDFKEIFDAANAHEIPMPKPWDTKLNEF